MSDNAGVETGTGCTNTLLVLLVQLSLVSRSPATAVNREASRKEILFTKRKFDLRDAWNNLPVPEYH
jgi:hypothetical protein